MPKKDTRQNNANVGFVTLPPPSLSLCWGDMRKTP